LTFNQPDANKDQLDADKFYQRWVDKVSAPGWSFCQRWVDHFVSAVDILSEQAW